MVQDPADYRRSSYGEAVGGGKRARAGLARVVSIAIDPKRDGGEQAWALGGLAKKYRELLLMACVEIRTTYGAKAGEKKISRKGMSAEAVAKELAAMETRQTDLPLAKALGKRVRYFTEGVAIGSRSFVEEVFLGCRSMFGPKRTTGARKTKGDLAQLETKVWSIRDLRASPPS